MCQASSLVEAEASFRVARMVCESNGHAYPNTDAGTYNTYRYNGQGNCSSSLPTSARHAGAGKPDGGGRAMAPGSLNPRLPFEGDGKEKGGYSRHRPAFRRDPAAARLL